ncbi:MAG: argininosuccinate lyase [Desulfovibrionales bacterium]|nr:argininosuccinate lyase [Desulfovibrionales bacterium]
MADQKTWGGRFSKPAADSLTAYTESVSFDRRLWAEDIRGSAAHARMLARQGVISEDDCAALLQGLEQVRGEIESGAFEWKVELEDVHMNIEARLTEIVGPVGGKLHTGRSRNDQVALDLRLYVDARLAEWRRLAMALVRVLADKARDHTDTLLPGCTHLQPAQPVSLAHHLLAYCFMLQRDVERVDDARKRVRTSPLGAAALAGTTYPLDPAAVAAELGFERVFENSMDAVSDRDFVLEALFAASIIMTHLSRLCEELIIWANPAFGFVKLPDDFSTGSSIMPQKRNPDVCEIMRGKVGRVHGDLMRLLVIMKGLPLTYNRDLQEDKEPFFDADDTVSASLQIMAEMMHAMEFVPERMRAALSKGFLNATELADYLAAKGLPFREAHHVSGRAVALAESRGVGLEDLPLDELKQLSDLVDEGVFEALRFDTAVVRRETRGGAGPGSVQAQLRALEAFLRDCS